MPKTIKLNATHYFIMEVRDKSELQKYHHIISLKLNFKDFMKLYKNYTNEAYSFLVSDTTLSSDDPL